MTKEELYQRTDGGLEIFKHYIPNLPTNTKKKFKLREDENTASTSLKRTPEGIYTIMDFGAFKTAKNAIDFIADEYGLEFGDAIRKIQEDLALQIEETPQPKEPMQPQKQNLTELSDKMLDYLEQRGISQFIIRQEKIGMQKGKYMGMAGGKIDVISIPFFDNNGVLVNYKHRGFFKKNGETKRAFQQEKDAKQVFYGINSVSEETTVVVFVEGEIDRLSVLEAFLDHENKNELACLSVPNGAKSLGQINECWDVIKDIERFIIFVDNDTPGRELKDELVRRLGAAKCQLVKVPSGCKDANDVLRNLGKEELVNLILDSEFIQVDGVFEFSEFDEDADDLFLNGLKKGVSISYLPQLSELITFDTSQLTIVTGIPGHGKSTILDQILVDLAREGWKSGLFSPEVSHPKIQLRKFSENYGGKIWPTSKKASLPENKDRVMSWEEYQETKRFVKSNFFWVEPKDYDIDSVLDAMAALVYRYGIKAVVLDPFNRIGKPKGFKGDKLDQINEILTKCNRFKRKYDVHIFLVAHPRKMSKNRSYTGNTGREDQYETKIWDIPTLYDIAHSSDFYNQADIGMTIYRNFENNLTEVHVQKMKMEDYGMIGSTYLKFDEVTRRYTEDGFTQPPIIGQTKEQVVAEQLQVLGPGSVSFSEEEDLPF